MADCQFDSPSAFDERYRELDNDSLERRIVDRRRTRSRMVGGVDKQRSPWETILNRYMTLAEHDAERAVLEDEASQIMEDGLQALRRAARKAQKLETTRIAAENRSNNLWVRENVTKCPGCRVRITKSWGMSITSTTAGSLC